MKRYEDAMDSFTTALELAETDEEKYDTLSQVITIGSEVEGMLYTMLNLLVALETEEFGIANELIEAGADVACALNQPHLQTKVVNLNFDLSTFCGCIRCAVSGNCCYFIPTPWKES